MRFCFAFLFLFAHSLEAADLRIEGGLGDWFGDETKSSYSYGGGLLWKPGPDYLELMITYDRSPVNVKAADRLGPDLKGDILEHWRFGFAFPAELITYGRKGYFFPSVSYVLVANHGRMNHGLGLGGGLGIPLVDDLLGVRFEAISQSYRIPKSTGGSTALQSDFFLNLRVEFKIF